MEPPKFSSVGFVWYYMWKKYDFATPEYLEIRRLAPYAFSRYNTPIKDTLFNLLWSTLETYSLLIIMV